MAYQIAITLVLFFFLSLALADDHSGLTHTYYIAAEEMAWDYAPVMPYDHAGDTWLDGTPFDRIGSVYKKALYVEYTDSTFNVKKAVAPEWEHKHLLGPIIRAQVGDEIIVNFKNKGSYNYSIHPHGLKYDKDSEGSFYASVTGPGGVPPGGSHVYRWHVPARSGPGPNDPSSICWLYYSDVSETADTNAGLVGAIIISKKGTSIDSNGKPMAIGKEVVLFFTVMNEGLSHFIGDNIATYTNQTTAIEADPNFEESNLMHTVNGRNFNNVRGINLAVGEDVRWYIMALGTEVDLHTIHWHALTTERTHSRTDVVQLLPASMATLDSHIDSAGTWFVHCHVNDHIVAGMIAEYTVTGTTIDPTVTGINQEYFIQAEEVAWNFADNMPLNHAGDTWLDGTPNNRIGHIYKKAIYVEYTDNTFTTKKAVASEWAHKEMLGPVIRAQVGDSITVYFRNNCTIKYSIHPHGVFYHKDSEGAWVHGINQVVGGVPPGGNHVYYWIVPERAGPGPNEPDSIVWLYHSHVDETMDTNSGLVGPMIISKKNVPIDSNGRPTSITKEVVLFFSVIDEGQSHYLADNVMDYTINQPSTIVDDPGFQESNLMHQINGKVFNNVPGIDLVVGDKVRWYIMALGTEVDLHTIHFHALTAIYKNGRTDVINMLPAAMSTFDTAIDSAGDWFVHCHVNDHIIAGMVAEYHVTGTTQAPAAPVTTHKYYVAADEVEWDYAPVMPLDGLGNTWLDGTPSNRIGSKYKKALYREYTDATFTTLKPPPAEWAHKEMLGPILRAQVGDIIEVHFKNNAQHTNYSMHPHGVFYYKSSEGAWLNGVTAPGGVKPGDTFTYQWYATERAGPTTSDPSSIVWFYHSHVDETADTNAGLVGAIVISRKNVALKTSGQPEDIDREFILFLTVMNEGESHYLNENINTYTTGQVASTLSSDGGFQESNLMHSINGRMFNNVNSMTMYEGEKVRWYLMALGTEVDLHTVHWHALTTVYQGSRTDVVELLPASMATVDSVIDSKGNWLVHCHVNDHVDAGMLSTYDVMASQHNHSHTDDDDDDDDNTSPTTKPTTKMSKATPRKVHYEFFLVSIAFLHFFGIN